MVSGAMFQAFNVERAVETLPGAAQAGTLPGGAQAGCDEL